VKSIVAAFRASLLVLVVMFFASMQPAQAATLNAYNYVYFDASDNIIGQALIDCRNNTSYAGQVSASNTYRYTQIWNCGGNYIVCDTSTPPNCTGVPTGPAYSQAFHSATGKSLTDYCIAPTAYSPGVAFSGHTDCGADQDGYRLQTVTFLQFTRGVPPGGF
jgi:hypothetical protein